MLKIEEIVRNMLRIFVINKYECQFFILESRVGGVIQIYSVSICFFCYLLLSSTIFCYLLLSSTIFCYLLLSSAIFYYLLLSSAIFYYLLLSSAIFCYLLLSSAIFCHLLLAMFSIRMLYLSCRFFQNALATVQPSAKREGFATVPDVSWQDIGALENIRDELSLAVLVI